MTDAYLPISGDPAVPIFVFGDHASNHIPKAYNNLGLEGEDLTRHIAWDIGTATIIQTLCGAFGCKGQLASISRLVIDYNRPPDGDGLIPAVTDGTPVPGNQIGTVKGRERRIARYHTPYHEALDQAIESIVSLHPNPLILSIHSFTDHPLTGDARKTDIGLLTRHDFPTTERFKASLEALAPQFCVEINQPYSAFELNYTIDRHVVPRGLRHLAIEVRQSHIETDAGAQAISALLIDAVKSLRSSGLKPEL